MVIDLEKSVSISEYASITVSGIKKEEIEEIEITFSKEALIGFATNLLWIYDDITESKRIHMHIDPLNTVNGGNQSLGFFLTPSSPSLVVCMGGKQEVKKTNIYKEVMIQKGPNKKINIIEPKGMEFIEDYELGYSNLSNITIRTINNNIIEYKSLQVILNLSYKGLIDFATMLLILANNFKRKIQYAIAQEGESENKYNMGILLSKESCACSIRCDELGCVYDYVSDFCSNIENS